MIVRALAVAVLLPAATAAQDLGRQVAAATGGQPAWVAYRVPMTGSHRVCCGDGFSGTCRLDGPDGITMSDDGLTAGRTVTIEPSSELLVFAHVQGGAVDRLRTFTPDCSLDATGARVVWLPAVRPADSAAWLASLARSNEEGSRRHVAQPAMAALALEAGDEATVALVTLARTDGEARVRGQALFWLGQRAGQNAAAAITDAIANDPETAIKKRAVFALSQMPKDEGVPLLIEVARTNRNPAVRKQAMFWLGQSHDPRAVSFFEAILKAK